MNELPEAKDVISFWKEAGPKKWFAKDDGFDADIHTRFAGLHEAASAGELDDWTKEPESCLALILVLDQFSRNLFRNSAKAFAQDAKALEIAKLALDKGYDTQVDREIFKFFYLPLMHDETMASQDRSVALYEAIGDENSLKFAKIHRDIIEQFGRFPHRNQVLGRETTPSEQSFLDSGGFSG